MTAHDFHYSLRRLLDPLTASRYAYLAWYIKNAKRYTSGGSGLTPGDPVEVELNPPADAPNTVRGKLLFGKLVRIDAKDTARDRVYVVQVDGQETAIPSGRHWQVARRPASSLVDRCCSTRASWASA